MFLHRLSLATAATLVLAACGTDPADADVAPLEAWKGTWQAAETFYRDDAASGVYQAIHDLRPEYTVDEIEALFIATADVDYSTLRVEADTLSFLDGATVVCAGRYRGAVSAAAPGPESTTDFTLAERSAGDCASYSTVTVTALLHPENPDHHFHIVTKTATGPLFPPPWNPSVWTMSTTATSFAQSFQAAVPAIASSLPAR